MHKISKKLNDKSGVSMLIALLFFLAVLTIGIIVLTAATSGAGRLSTIRSQEQDYYTVSSAARMISDQLSSFEYDSKSKDDSSAFPILNEEIKDLLDTCLAANATNLDPYTFTVESKNTRPVYGDVRMRMQASGNQVAVEFKLWLAENETSTDRQNQTVVKFLISVDERGLCRWNTGTIVKEATL